jgi:integrase/recombinase XerD
VNKEINATKFLSDEDVKELLDNIRFLDLHQRLVIKFLLNLGMRRQELVDLKMRNVDRNNWTIFVPGVKGSRGRNFPIPKTILSEFKHYINTCERSLDDSLFPLSYRQIQTLWDKVRPRGKKLGVHCLRHTFAIKLFKHSRDIKLVQTCLGHRSIQNTMVYADYVYSVEEIDRAFQDGLFGEVRFK